MSGPIDTRVRCELARAVAEARASACPWKTLVWRHKRSRTALAALARWGARLLSAANDNAAANGVRADAPPGKGVAPTRR